VFRAGLVFPLPMLGGHMGSALAWAERLNILYTLAYNISLQRAAALYAVCNVLQRCTTQKVALNAVCSVMQQCTTRETS